MPRLRQLIVAVVAAGLVAGACGTDEAELGSSASGTGDDGSVTAESAEPEDSSTTTAAESSTTTTTAAVAEPDTAAADPAASPTVTVLDAGSEPRTELRFDLADGATETMVMSQTQELVQELDGTQIPSVGPLSFGGETTIRTATEGDRYRVTAEVTSMELGDGVDPAVAQAVEPELANVVGLTTEMVLDRRGRAIENDVTGLDELGAVDELLGETLQSEQLAVPLPEEAVGVGAVWEVRQVLPIAGTDVEQVSTYELVGMDGSQVSFAVSTTQSVPSGTTIDLAGVTATVEEWEVTGSSDLTLDLGGLGVTGAGRSEGTQRFSLTQAGQTSTLVQRITTTMETSTG